MKKPSGERRVGPFAAIAVFFVFAAACGPLLAASSDCSRNCEVWAYGYKEPPPGTKTQFGGKTVAKIWESDPTFNRSIFLGKFGDIFSSSRLKLDTKQKPEYSLTATFSKITEFASGKTLSCLTVILGFNAGKNGSGTGNQTFHEQIFPAHYHYQRLLTWASLAPGHDLSAHVSQIAAQVKSAEINQTLTACEQVPISVELEQTPYWCDEQARREDFKIKLNNFKAAAEKLRSIVYEHNVRIVVRAEKGKIRNGVPLTGDDKARVFSFAASEVGFRAAQEIVYSPPAEADRSDTITVYNSCEVRFESVIPLAETEKKDKLIEIQNECGWEGTLSMKESMAAGEKGSGLASLLPGMEYDLAKNWTIQLKLKRKSDSGNITRYEVEEATLKSFKDTLDATLAKMEREGRKIESRSKQSAKASGRGLGKGECDLELAIDSKDGTYSLAGGIDVQGIKIRGQDEMEIKVKPINKDIDEEAGGTTGIDEEVEISGEFPPSDPPCVPEELKGSKDLMDEVGDEFRKFLEDLGGKQSYVMSWELKRKPVKVTKF